MSEQENYCEVDLFTFLSSHHTLKAEKLCRATGIPTAFIPLPREISSDCGVALIIRPEVCQDLEELLGQKGIPVQGVHRILREGREARLWQKLLSE